MPKPPSNFSGAAFVGLVLIGFTAIAVFLLVQVQRRTGDASSSGSATLPVYSQVGSFSLTNQSGIRVGVERYTGGIWIAQIIFSRCPGPCPRMTQFFARLQAQLPKDARVSLVTLTTDPQFDTPEVLKAYAARFGARLDRWDFLTGEKSEIVRLASGGLGLTTVDKSEAQKEGENDLFIHSTISVVLDAKARVRATIESLEPDAEQKVVEVVSRLLKEKQ